MDGRVSGWTERVWTLGLAGALLLLAPHPARGAPLPSSRSPAFLTPEVERAIARGIGYLLAQQAPTGIFTGGQGAVMRQNKNKHQILEEKSFPAATTAVAVLALLTNGEAPGKGRYGEAMDKALKALLEEYRDPFTGVIASRPHGQALYEHAFCTTVLAEVHGQWRRNDLRDVIEQAVEVLVRTQAPDGGFPYAMGDTFTRDMTCSGTALLALRAARDAFITTPERTLAKAGAYMKTLVGPDGSFFYSSRQRDRAARGITEKDRGPMAEPTVRAAIGLLCLWATGDWNSPEARKAIALLQGVPGLHPYFPFYGAYYQVRALYLAGGEGWARWYPKFQTALLKAQQPDGSFRFGPAPDHYTHATIDTGFAVAALAIQKGLLPLFER